MNAMGMHSSKYGGLERFMVSMAEELFIKKIVLIVIYNSEPSSKKFVQDFTFAGGKIVVANAMHPVRYFISILKLFVNYRPVLFHAHFQLYYSIIFAKLLMCRHIFATLHVMFTDDKHKVISDINEITRYTRIFRKIINRYASKIITVSDAVNRQYSMLFPEIKNKLVTIYLGTNPTHSLEKSFRASTLGNHGKVNIGTIGFNSSIKGLDILMNAMVILINDLNCSNFIVSQVGIDPSDPQNSSILREAEDKGIINHILWIGITNDVQELLPVMDIYCQPSRSEALSLSIMEAGMAGLPVVGSNIGGIPEVINHGYNGFVFENGNANQLANCLYNLINDPELRNKMGRNSKDYMMKKFNIHLRVKDLCSNYLSELGIN